MVCLVWNDNLSVPKRKKLKNNNGKVITFTDSEPVKLSGYNCLGETVITRGGAIVCSKCRLFV